MRLFTNSAHVFLTVFIILLLGSAAELNAQGKGKNREGENRGRKAERQNAPQRQAPQVRQQSRREVPQLEQRQIRQERPQFDRRAQRQFPQVRQQRQESPQIDRRAQQRQERPQFDRRAQRQFPQVRQQQRQERPQIDRRAQRQFPQVRQQQRQERPQFDRRAQRQNDQRLNRVREQQQRPEEFQSRGRDNGRYAGNEKSRPQLRDAFRNRRYENNRDRIDFGKRNARIEARQKDRFDRNSRNLRQRDNSASLFDYSRRDRRAERWDDRFERRGDQLDRRTLREFRGQVADLRRLARRDGRSFNERAYRANLYEYDRREAWRNNVLRSAISINFGYSNGYGYISPPAYSNYYDIGYDPRYYNIRSTYYYPDLGSYYVEPYSYAYRPYDYNYSSYNYYDPYYLDDPTDDFLTVRILSSSYATNFESRFVGGLLSYGYEQGYRDGISARANRRDRSYYDDPFVYYDEPYEDAAYYEPYSYSIYENRRCLSKGYDLGYQDALYGDDDYVPEYYGGDLVSLWIGASFQIS
ncbi:MAG: hypothetical protein ACRD6X_01760 [Pyrinomonadaceae bacterium]